MPTVLSRLHAMQQCLVAHACAALLCDACCCRDVFQQCYNRLPRKLPLKFALPGAERQDSVFNGFQQIDAAAQVGGRSREGRWRC